ncbi:thioredoxin family protein [Xylophilus ampelinus]|uniref:Thioredoxin 1 n=1 Tax=Xylophilus ampelinus TaxID=54067 RepID=A0A318SQX9_9BURK|nr:thioredoxin family protein [Xylophilus ampelinus]MCS4509002.1 thioredoxin family protein [Xylophilus ampelinus]PYE79972.1 thioredoxin 1 [Xylophilus ampelinus]
MPAPVVPYSEAAPTRAEVDAMAGPVLLDFGTNWCGFCQRAQPAVDQVLAAHPQVRHIKVEDGPGRALGRAFKVKLWPTLIAVRDGVELARVVRPADAQAVEEVLTRLMPTA